MTFSEQLLQRRKALGMSQEELAAQVQVSRQAVSKWETGDAMPDLNKLLALADALQISLDALCGRESPPEETAQPETPETKRRGQWLWPALCGVLAVCLLTAGGLWAWSQRNVVPSEAASAASTLPDTFTVSGESFSYRNGYLNYTFTPSVTGEQYAYQITFTGTDNHPPQTFDVDCVGGVCSGTAYLSEYDVYSVTVSISSENDSRAKAIAINLSFAEGRSSWTPLD